MIIMILIIIGGLFILGIKDSDKKSLVKQVTISTQNSNNEIQSKSTNKLWYILSISAALIASCAILLLKYINLYSKHTTIQFVFNIITGIMIFLIILTQ